MIEKQYDFLINSFYFRILDNNYPVTKTIFILIHGWTGNETSMSIFLPSIGDFGIFIFPRGIVNIAENQYGWVDVRNSPNNSFSDYELVAKHLHSSLNELFRTINKSTNGTKINLIGFSQGAAICVALSILFPDDYKKVALLSGFLPYNPPDLEQNKLLHLNYYIAHGKFDKIVSYNEAVYLQNYLNKYGASTKLCEEDLGHKIGKNCLLNLRNFFMGESLNPNE